MLILSIFKKYNVYLALLLLLPLQNLASATTQKTSSTSSLASTILVNPAKQQAQASSQADLPQLKIHLFKKKLAKISTLLDSIFGVVLLVVYGVLYKQVGIDESVLLGGALNAIFFLITLIVRLAHYIPHRKRLSNLQYLKNLKGIFYTDGSLITLIIIASIGFFLRKGNSFFGLSTIGLSFLHFVMMIVRNIIYWKNVPPSKKPANVPLNKEPPTMPTFKEASLVTKHSPPQTFPTTKKSTHFPHTSAPSTTSSKISLASQPHAHLKSLAKKLAKISTILDSIFGVILLVVYGVLYNKLGVEQSVFFGGVLNAIFFLITLIVRLAHYIPRRKSLSNPKYHKSLKGIFYADGSLITLLIIACSLFFLSQGNPFFGLSTMGLSFLHFVMMIVRNIIYWKNVPPSKKFGNVPPNKEPPTISTLTEASLVTKHSPPQTLPTAKEREKNTSLGLESHTAQDQQEAPQQVSTPQNAQIEKPSSSPFTTPQKDHTPSSASQKAGQSQQLIPTNEGNELYKEEEKILPPTSSAQKAPSQTLIATNETPHARKRLSFTFSKSDPLPQKESAPLNTPADDEAFPQEEALEPAIITYEKDETPQIETTTSQSKAQPLSLPEETTPQEEEIQPSLIIHEEKPSPQNEIAPAKNESLVVEQPSHTTPTPLEETTQTDNSTPQVTPTVQQLNTSPPQLAQNLKSITPPSLSSSPQILYNKVLKKKLAITSTILDVIFSSISIMVYLYAFHKEKDFNAQIAHIARHGTATTIACFFIPLLIRLGMVLKPRSLSLDKGYLKKMVRLFSLDFCIGAYLIITFLLGFLLNDLRFMKASIIGIFGNLITIFIRNITYWKNISKAPKNVVPHDSALPLPHQLKRFAKRLALTSTLLDILYGGIHLAVYLHYLFKATKDNFIFHSATNGSAIAILCALIPLAVRLILALKAQNLPLTKRYQKKLHQLFTVDFITHTFLLGFFLLAFLLDAINFMYLSLVAALLHLLLFFPRNIIYWTEAVKSSTKKEKNSPHALTKTQSAKIISTSAVPSLQQGTPSTLIPKSPTTPTVTTEKQPTHAQTIDFKLFKKKLAKTTTILDSIVTVLLLALYTVLSLKENDFGAMLSALAGIGGTWTFISFGILLVVRLTLYFAHYKKIGHQKYHKKLKALFWTDLGLGILFIVGLIGEKITSKAQDIFAVFKLIGIAINFILVIVRNTLYWRKISPSGTPPTS